MLIILIHYKVTKQKQDLLIYFDNFKTPLRQNSKETRVIDS
jgi:hypothetical protein